MYIHNVHVHIGGIVYHNFLNFLFMMHIIFLIGEQCLGKKTLNTN